MGRSNLPTYQFYPDDHFQNAWDGTMNGKEMPEGVYLVLLPFEDLEGASQQVIQDVTLIR